MKVRAALLAMGISAVGLLGGAGQAAAEVSPKASCHGGTSTGAEYCFHAKGDKISITNFNTGYTYKVNWKTNYGRKGKCTNSGGHNHRVVCNYNMKEGKKITFRLEEYHNGKMRSAWDWRSATI
ncbi:hypothetical protein EV191_108188 [Tamaricihabitans halophyticus]|uniref:Peptidase inhibitor family I36 n=1 Tax=Tamaricihabitans halophyticus TaxID=1262583 RepID=A0A4R2QMI5_9PSEU|nr:hypothetical protein [Tamaricihabitans halophyticus]TCP50099.1 hypothetical protein EV191_108188 [Tamaricihabitans halophyticus]